MNSMPTIHGFPALRSGLCLLISLTGTLILQSNFAGQGDTALQLRGNVVRISVGGNNPENGFGFVIGEREHTVFIVTADHVVAAAPGEATPPVNATFFDDQGRNYAAEVLKQNKDHDLALLAVSLPSGFKWKSACLAPAEESRRGTPVWFIGRDVEWYVPAAAGVISSQGASPDAWLDADITNLRPGSSGAPLVTKTGIVGMVRGQSADDTRVLSSEYIKATVQSWGYPWGLTKGVGPAWSDVEMMESPVVLSVERDGSRANYGYSSIRHTDTITGERLRIDRVNIRMTLRAYTPSICCDVSLMLAPSSSFLSTPGQITAGPNPFYIEPQAPIQVRFVLGTLGKPVTPGIQVLEASYDLETNQSAGNVDRMKPTVGGRYLDLPDGLNMQLFLWNGNPETNVEVQSVKVTVEFNW